VEGIFRLRDVQFGTYEVTLAKEGFKTLVIPHLELTKREPSVLELRMQALTEMVPENKGPSGLPGTQPTPPAATAPTTPYPGTRGPAPDAMPVQSSPEQVPPDSANFSPELDRWDIAMPEWRRYDQESDAPYVKGHWYDPFNRNRLKGDYPIFGQRWFFNFTGTSETGVDGRRVPLPSGVDTEHAGSSDFFGRGEQAPALDLSRIQARVAVVEKLVEHLPHVQKVFRPGIEFESRVEPAHVRALRKA